MSGTTVTRQRTRSNSNVKLIDHSALDAIEKENRAKNSKKGKAAEKKQQTAVNLGEIAWDEMFAEGSFNLPSTRFMEKVKQAVTEEDFQHIKREILNTLKDEKDHFCGSNYSTLTEAKNKLYSMLTEILVQEAGSVIDYDIRMVNYERDEIKKQMSQIKYNTNRANAKKASRDTLVKELKVAKEELVKSAQDERKQESTGDQNKDKVRSDTAA